ncbi:MAG: thioesterase family protein [Acidimicrobiaceae bacterium]|nr:thioesterase family protein [Acidimicrobiaceae bacterium]
MNETLGARALREAAAVDPLAPGRYGVQISGYFTVASGIPNGGYLQCLMANGALAAASAEGSKHVHATSISTNYIGAPVAGAAEVRTDVRRIGRGVSFVHATLIQNDQVMTESLVTVGTLRDDSPIRFSDFEIPEVAPLEVCRRSTGGDDVNIMKVLDLRLDPQSTGWWTGELSGSGDVRGWLRLDDGDAPWSAWSLLFASDAMPPATFSLGSSGWVPTLQLTSYVRRIPTSEWLRARQWCVVVADGLVDERCVLFDERGELVASSSQIAMVRFPGSH